MTQFVAIYELHAVSLQLLAPTPLGAFNIVEMLICYQATTKGWDADPLSPPLLENGWADFATVRDIYIIWMTTHIRQKSNFTALYRRDVS